MPTPLNIGALPATQFIPGKIINGGVALPISAPVGSTRLPAAPKVLDISGYNALAVFLTVASLPAGNDLVLRIDTIDPETAAVIPSNLAELDIVSASADGNYAGSVYLPAYYDGLTGLILPFLQSVFNLSHAGPTNTPCSITALKIWLGNA